MKPRTVAMASLLALFGLLHAPVCGLACFAGVMVAEGVAVEAAAAATPPCHETNDAVPGDVPVDPNDDCCQEFGAFVFHPQKAERTGLAPVYETAPAPAWERQWVQVSVPHVRDPRLFARRIPPPDLLLQKSTRLI